MIFTKNDALRIGRSLGINFKDFDLNEFTLGLNVDMRQGSVLTEYNVAYDNPIVKAKIAWAHLLESPNYYTLKKGIL